MKHIKKFGAPINESKSIDPVESMEVHSMQWDDEDFGSTKTLVVKTKSGKIYKAKLSSAEDDYDDGPDL